jgi:hypothetical protein
LAETSQNLPNFKVRHLDEAERLVVDIKVGDSVNLLSEAPQKEIINTTYDTETQGFLDTTATWDTPVGTPPERGRACDHAPITHRLSRTLPLARKRMAVRRIGSRESRLRGPEGRAFGFPPG